MINFVLCDDNTQMLSKLKMILENIFIKYDLPAKVSFSTANSTELIPYFTSNKVDVLFLDIDLHSKINGIDLAKQIRKENKSVYIIFITGHFEYIVSAYECKTFDFIQKPFSKQKIERTILRLFEDINYNNSNFISIDNNHQFINQSEINFIQKDGMKMLYNLHSSTIEAYGSFSKFR